MTDKKSIESRRKLLKSIAAGGGAIVAGKSLPESWSRPIVDSVMLPAHAQTSGGFAGAAGSVSASISQESNLFAILMDRMVEPAHASVEPTVTYKAEVCVDDNGNGTANVKTVVSRDDGDCMFSNKYEATNVPIGINAGYKNMKMTARGCDDASILPFINNAHAVGATFDCQVKVLSINGVATGRIKVTDYDVTVGLDFTLDLRACSLPNLVCCPER
jgi:hypothetical protein